MLIPKRRLQRSLEQRGFHPGEALEVIEIIDNLVNKVTPYDLVDAYRKIASVDIAHTSRQLHKQNKGPQDFITAQRRASIEADYAVNGADFIDAID